jgi:chromate transport protein ChrA
LLNITTDLLTSTVVAVYLSALASKYTLLPTAATAFIGFLGIFTPGITLATGFQSLWGRIRRWRAVQSAVRGTNAAAVGLIWTAVYRLWEIGYLREGMSTGTSLGAEPFYLVIAAMAFSSNRWYRVPAPVAIVFGGALGLVRFAIVGRS